MIIYLIPSFASVWRLPKIINKTQTTVLDTLFLKTYPGNVSQQKCKHLFDRIHIYNSALSKFSMLAYIWEVAVIITTHNNDDHSILEHK